VTEDENWTAGQRFVLKACDLWESPAVDFNWRLKEAVKTCGLWVDKKLDLKAKVGGTPTRFKEWWFDTLKRGYSPKPEWVVENWAAYDRWLIENYETHRSQSAA
jgi:hypothetical protein